MSLPRRLHAPFVFAMSGGVLLVLALLATQFVAGGSHRALAANCAPSLPHAPGQTLETIVSDSTSRQYYLRVPPSYTGITPVPLVFLWHGRNGAGSASLLPLFTKLDAKANAENFILVMPVGLPGPFGATSWFNSPLDPAYPSDLQFASDMLDELESELCIDPQRVFSTGYSNGGIMSVRLMCSMSDRIAAIAPVVGIYYPPISASIAPTENCPDTRPVPMIAFVGEDDLYLPFHGGSNFILPDWRDVEAEIMPDIATHNGCSTTPVNSYPFPGVRLAENPGCADGARTMLYIVEDVDGPGPLTEGMGHQWPDSIIDVTATPGNPSLGLNTHLISATNLMWDFFVAHPMAASTGTPTPSDSPTPAAPTSTASATPTASASPTPSASATPTPTGMIATSSPTPTVSPSPTPSASAAPTPTGMIVTPSPTSPTPAPAPVGGSVVLSVSHDSDGISPLLVIALVALAIMGTSIAYIHRRR